MSLFEKAKRARENKKGFTLVELIVVLVILAILAAIMVPQLVGYIDKAKDKQYMVRARNIMIAAQTVLDEAYAKEPAATGSKTYSSDSDKVKDSSGDDINLFETVLKLAEEKDSSGADLNDDPAAIASIATEANSYKIKAMSINFTTSNKTLTYKDNKWGKLTDTTP